MNFSQNIDELMKPFIASFGKCPKPKNSPETLKKYKEVLSVLYQVIYEAHHHVFQRACFKSQVVAIRPNEGTIKRPDIFNGRYFPQQIQDYISANEKYQLIFSCQNVGNREINIIFTIFSEEDKNNIEKYVSYANAMYMWLYICAKYATKNCSKTLDIYLYQTPFTKNLPENMTTILGPEHVNTAFTYACMPRGQMLIFRDEEWFKVFLHETFHSYGLDFTTHEETELKKHMYNLFPINSEFDMYEAYTETWARIMNCALCGFNTLANKKDKKAFIENTTFCIEMERMFAIYQCNKMLGFMGLQYQDIHLNGSNNINGNNLYRENTHVFAYYVMTAIFLNDYQGFLVWCQTHNTALLKFERTQPVFKAFADYIESIYTCDTLIQNMGYMRDLYKRIYKNKTNNNNNKYNKKKLINTSRMSLVHTLG